MHSEALTCPHGDVVFYLFLNEFSVARGRGVAVPLGFVVVDPSVWFLAILNANHIAELERMGVELALVTMYDLYPQSIIVVFDKGADEG